MNKKRLIVVASLTMAVALILSCTTVGYLTSAKSAVNRVGVGSMVPDIHENSSTTPNSVNSVPEDNKGVFPKEIRVQNTDIPNAVDAYVRVQLVPTLRDVNSNLGGNFKMEAPTRHTVNGKTYDKSILFVPFGNPEELQILLVFHDSWDTNANGCWQYREADNFFYYTHIVKPGKYTEQPLLSKVIFFGDSATLKTWEEKFNLDVVTDSIQADGTIMMGNTKKYAAEEAWPVTIDKNRKLMPNS